MPGSVNTAERLQVHPDRLSATTSRQAFSTTGMDADVETCRDIKRTLQFHRRLPSELQRRLWTEPDRLITEGIPLKMGSRCTVVRIECGGKIYVIKRYNLRGPLHTAAHLLLPSRAHRCWKFGRLLGGRNIRTPLPLAFLEHHVGPLKTRSFLVTEFVDGIPLSDFLPEEGCYESGHVLTTVTQQFADIWQNLGELGLSHGDMKASNFLVTRDGSIWLIDLDGMNQHRSSFMFQRSRRNDKRRFMQNWKTGSLIAQSFGVAFEKSLDNFPTKTSAPKINAQSKMSTDVSSPHIWVAPRYRPILETAGLDQFEAMMNTTDGHLMRQLADRENWRLDLVDDTGKQQRAYLKKHHFRNGATLLRKLVGLGPGKTPGRDEAEKIFRLDEQGIPTMSLMAFGERLETNGQLQSFLLTEELNGYEQLDLFLPRRFSAEKTADGPALTKLIEQVADVARKFHRLGYNHRDFYTCHFFIRENEPGEFNVNLIDLQRVQQRRYFRGRWVVKDLAQLAYSSPADPIGNRQRMQFIKQYLGVNKLRLQDKRLIRSVLSRESRMKRKLGSYR